MTALAAPLLGDLRARPDGGFDGWCWAPDRPTERLVVELLVDDTLALSMVAAIFRRDVLALGCGDGQHGFALHLPPHLLPPGQECLITARERHSRRVFGRVLREAAGLAPPGLARIAAAADAVAALRQEVAAIGGALTLPPPQARLRGAFGRLGGRLAARARAGRPCWPGEPADRMVLPTVREPRLTLVLRAGSAAATLRRIAALAPALAAAEAELLVADCGADPATALLPARVRNLSYLRDAAADDPGTVLRLAAEVGRGRALVLLDGAPAAPSAAALLALARGLAAAPAALLLAEPAAATTAALAAAVTAETLCLPAPLGVLLGAERPLWREIGATPAAVAGDRLFAAADLALRARQLGRSWRIVREPAGMPAADTGPAAALAAARQLHARWSFAA